MTIMRTKGIIKKCILHVSHDVASERDLTPCNKIDNHQWFTDLVTLRNGVQYNVV